GAGIKEAPDLLAAEEVGELLRLFGGGDVEVGPWAAEGDVIEKAECVCGLGARAPGAFSHLEQVREVRLDLIGGELIRRAAIVAGQADDLSDIRLVRARGEPSDGHVAEHSGAQLTH